MVDAIAKKIRFYQVTSEGITDLAAQEARNVTVSYNRTFTSAPIAIVIGIDGQGAGMCQSYVRGSYTDHAECTIRNNGSSATSYAKYIKLLLIEP